MIVCGSGGFADSSREWNLFILGAITGALDRGKKVAMLGQGVGPLTDPLVLSWARRVLPRVSLIGFRGTKGGRKLLEDMGVGPSRILMTGDDALELGQETNMNATRCAIGVNLRSAPYSNVDVSHIADLRGILHDAARKYNADLLPIPITSHEYADDRESIRQLLEGFDDNSDGGTDLDTPLKVVEQTARCRVVVTGAYHAAVFALGIGIPVICLFNSSYYAAKFEGLEESFRPGCWIISLKEPDCAEKLAAALDDAWISADYLREKLLGSAKIQIEAGRSAYRRLKNLDYSRKLDERVVSHT
jgi:colanic acid/amylovoran biosynthesis protein